MADYLDFPDNLVLHLERDKRSYKVFTTDKRGVFKVLNGLSERDSIVDTSYVGERYLKQLFVDSCVNGYELKSNLIFKKSLLGIAQELAKEREEQIKLEMKEEPEEICEKNV